MKVPFTCLAIHVPKDENSVKAQGTGSHSHPEFVGFRNCRLDTRILKIEIKKNGISKNNFVSNDFVPNSFRPVFHTPGVQEEHEVLRRLFPGPVRCAWQSSSERVPFVSGVTKM